MDWWKFHLAVAADTWVSLAVECGCGKLNDSHNHHKSNIQYFFVGVVVVVHVDVVGVVAQAVDDCPAMAGGRIWEQVVGMVDPVHVGQPVDLLMEFWDAGIHYLCQVGQVSRILACQVSEIVIQFVDYVGLVTVNAGEAVDSVHVTVTGFRQHF